MSATDKPKRNLGRGGILWVAIVIALALAGTFAWIVLIEPRLG